MDSLVEVGESEPVVAGLSSSSGMVSTESSRAAIIDENFTLENIDREEGNFLISKKVLGKGATSEVKLAWSKKLNKKCAVKIITKYKLTERSNSNVKREIEILERLKELNSPHICNMIDKSETNQHYFLFLEYVEGGDLISLLSTKGKLPEHLAKSMFRRILEGIQFIHSNSIVHRDIKCENYLVEMDEEGQIGDLKLTDFGLADWTSSGRIFNNPCGSPHYMAPEVLADMPLFDGEPADIWSAGVLLYAMLVCEFPFVFPTTSGLAQMIRTGSITFPSFMSSHASDLIKRMLDRNASTRISAREALSHAWFST